MTDGTTTVSATRAWIRNNGNGNFHGYSKEWEEVMQFAIQTSNPRVVSQVLDSDKTIGEAIQSIFPLMAEYAFLIWDGVFVPMGYKYDMGIIVDDIIDMVLEICSSETGVLEVTWPSSTFHANWHLTWDVNSVSIKSEWISVVGYIGPVLEMKRVVTVPRTEFLGEWVRLLAFIRKHLLDSGVLQTSIDLSRLNDACSCCVPFGCLY